jgi:alpha-amylase
VKNQPGQATPTGAPDTGDDFSGARDLDHTSTIVQDNIKGYLQFLKNEMGYSGWRYDMTKGFSASYVNQYNNTAGNYFSVGEFFDGDYTKCQNWINGCGNNSTTFDFPLKFKLNEAMWNGGMDLTKLVWLADGTTQQPAGLIHHYSTKRYAVTFLDNHDTYRDNNKFSGNILAAYAFLMGSPGVPCVFLPHWNANKTAISAMITARRAVQLHSESSVTVNQSASNIYVATATGFSGSLIVKIGSGNYSAPTGYTLAASGTDYAIWTKVDVVAPILLASPSGGTYFSSQTVYLSASPGASIYYTTDNSVPTISSTLYTTPIIISSSKTLRAIAYNPTTQLYSEEASNTYIITTMPTSITVHFKAPADWTACKVYTWKLGTNTSWTGAWPGTTMTLESNGYYLFTITGFTDVPIGVIFNNGASAQTVDLNTSTDKCWDAGLKSGANYTAIETACLFTGVDNKAESNWRIYPNPTHDLIYFNMPAGLDEVTLTSAVGKKLPVKPILTSGSSQIDLSGYPSGVYYISLTGPNGNRVTKAVMKY